MKQQLPLVLALLALSAASSGETRKWSFEYEGLHVGMTSAEVKTDIAKHHPSEIVKCKPDECEVFKTESDSTKDFWHIDVHFTNQDRVESIAAVLEASFDASRTLLLKKYGPPEKNSRAVMVAWSPMRIAHWTKLDCPAAVSKDNCYHYESLALHDVTRGSLPVLEISRNDPK
jgi:hypothetical protein